jgi:Poly(ADP-ribose) polymerase catalytic domain
MTAGLFSACGVYCVAGSSENTSAHSCTTLAQVLRKGEAQRFQQHTELGNRRLLWHGTNVAVVAAVLKTGLRIMPHSGGRVGEPWTKFLVLLVCVMPRSHDLLPDNDHAQTHDAER